MMWVLYAFGSALFAGLTSILAKCGIRKTNSTIATAIRTIVVLIFSWIMVFLVGSEKQLASIPSTAWVYLVLSGLATGASWLCYFRALQLGDVNKVVPVDKSSTILTILLALLLFPETERVSWLKWIAIVLVAAGTFLMVERKASSRESKSRAWLLYAVLSAVFASLVSILGKLGMQGIDSNLGTAIRTCVVLAMAWLVVAVTGLLPQVAQTPKQELLFICLSGLATGGSWLCYFRALQEGPASAVACIDKLSILITVGFSYLVFKEKLSRRSAIGLAVLTAGTLLMLVKI